MILQAKKYSGVKSLYKYGCGACSDKTRNKWWGLCTLCQERAQAPKDNGLLYGLQLINDLAQDIQDQENPSLQNDSNRAGYGQHPTTPDGSIRERSPLKDNSASDGPNNAAAKKIKLF